MISYILSKKYPNIDFMKDVQLSDYGDGKTVISKWSESLGKQPTQEELTKWETELKPEFDQQQKDLNFKVVNKTVLDQLSELDVRAIRAIRENDTQRLTDLNKQSALLRLQLEKS